MSYKKDERVKFIIDTETKAIINALEDLNERYIYLNCTVSDLLEIENEKKEEVITNYIQSEILKNIKEHEDFKEFKDIFIGCEK